MQMRFFNPWKLEKKRNFRSKNAGILSGVIFPDIKVQVNNSKGQKTGPMNKKVFINKSSTFYIKTPNIRPASNFLCFEVSTLLKNRATTCRAMILPGDCELLSGAISLEDMDVLIHPQRQELIVNPDHPYFAQMKLK